MNWAKTFWGPFFDGPSVPFATRHQPTETGRKERERRRRRGDGFQNYHHFFAIAHISMEMWRYSPKHLRKLVQGKAWPKRGPQSHFLKSRPRCYARADQVGTCYRSAKKEEKVGADHPKFQLISSNLISSFMRLLRQSLISRQLGWRKRPPCQ